MEEAATIRTALGVGARCCATYSSVALRHSVVVINILSRAFFNILFVLFVF